MPNESLWTSETFLLKPQAVTSGLTQRELDLIAAFDLATTMVGKRIQGLINQIGSGASATEIKNSLQSEVAALLNIPGKIRPR